MSSPHSAKMIPRAIQKAAVPNRSRFCGSSQSGPRVLTIVGTADATDRLRLTSQGYPASWPARPRCVRAQLCMAMAAAAATLIDRVDPYWLMDSTASDAREGLRAEPGPLLAEQQDAPARHLVLVDRDRPRAPRRWPGSAGPCACAQSCRSSGSGWWVMLR